MYLQDNTHGQPSGTSKQEQLSDDSLRSEDYTSYGQYSYWYLHQSYLTVSFGLFISV